MAKTYLRIANRNPASARGFFPRRYLRVVGATTKRENENDEDIGGQFGSGKKFAPVAALALGMEVHLTSQDALGPYLYAYDKMPDPEGEPFDVVVMRGESGESVPLDVSTDACRNWQESIGDDPMKSYHVLREYMRDAKDADPDGPHLEETGIVHQAVTGTTSVYLSMTDEIRHMLAHKDRYFKYLVKGLQPIYSVGNVGAIYPKSDPGVTRLFSQGSLALCSKKGADTTLYDYSFVSKKLLSEERNFRSIAAVRTHLATILANIQNVDLARSILNGILQGKAPFEEYALGYLGGSVKFRGGATWRAAWETLWPGKKSVISSFYHMYDEYARVSCGRNVVTVTSSYLRGFLKRCGVKEAKDFYPEHLKNARIVTPTAERQRVVEEATRILGKYGLTEDSYPVFLYEPIVKMKTNPDLGFCIFDGPGRGIYLLDEMADDALDALETLYHEHCHARTKAYDGSREFDDQKDTDIARLLFDLENLAYPLGDEDIEEVEGEASETEKALSLIGRMIEEAEPEPSE